MSHSRKNNVNRDNFVEEEYQDGAPALPKRDSSSGYNGPSTSLDKSSSGIHGSGNGLSGSGSGFNGPRSGFIVSSNGLNGPTSSLNGPSNGLNWPGCSYNGPSSVLNGPNNGLNGPSSSSFNGPSSSGYNRPSSSSSYNGPSSSESNGPCKSGYNGRSNTRSFSSNGDDEVSTKMTLESCLCLLCERVKERAAYHAARRQSYTRESSTEEVQVFNGSSLENISQQCAVSDSVSENVCNGTDTTPLHSNGSIGDDMENYYRQNAPRLPSSDSNESGRASKESSEDSAISGACVGAMAVPMPVPILVGGRCDDDDSDEGGVFVCGDEEVVNNVAVIDVPARLNDSFEDQGDFIESDIAQNSSVVCSQSESTSSSSYENLQPMNIRDEDPSEPLIFDHPQISTTAYQCECGKNKLQNGAKINFSDVVLNRPCSSSGQPHYEVVRPKTLSPKVACGDTTAGGPNLKSDRSSSTSSHRTTSSSFLSPQFSDSSAFYGIASESSTFVSPDVDHAPDLPVLPAAAKRQNFFKQRSMDGREHSQSTSSSDANHVRSAHSSSDIQDNSPLARAFGNPRRTSSSSELENFDLLTLKASHDKMKHFDVRRCDKDMVNMLRDYHHHPKRRGKRFPHHRFSDGSLIEAASAGPSDPHANPDTNNLNSRHSYSLQSTDDIQDKHLNVSRQTSTSNLDHDENRFEEVEELNITGNTSSYDPQNSDDNIPESQDNQNNVNHENSGQHMGSFPPYVNPPPPISHHLHPSPITNTRPPRKVRHKKGGSSSMGATRGRPQGAGKLKVKPGHVFQEFEDEYTHANYEKLFDLGSSSSEDDGYVDFQVLLKNYMVQRLHDKHANTLEQQGSHVTVERVEKVMLWTEYEAYMSHIRQIGTSACGATAVINVLKALDFPWERDKICENIKTNLRAEKALLAQYLLSRSIAGTHAEQLIEGISKSSSGMVYGRFFHMFPARDVHVGKWLAHWMKKGAIPLLTLNLQKAVPSGYNVPDAWHHQMAFGVGPKGVYLTNPQEIVPEHVIQKQLCSDSLLLVRRKDITQRWSQDCQLAHLINQPDPRWRTMNVLGQVINIMREEKMQQIAGSRPLLTSHITIPAWYKSGITLYTYKDSALATELREAPELPVKGQIEIRVQMDRPLPTGSIEGLI